MVKGTCLDLLSDVVIAIGHHRDVLLVLRLLLVQNFSNEKLHSTTEVCLARAILLNWYILWIGQFREVLANGLLPGSFVLALEYILELHRGVSIVKVDLLSPFLNSGIVLLIVNLTPSFPLSWWTPALVLFESCYSAICKSWVAWFSHPMSFLGGFS